jgi:acetate---CoA ligase (ADP-forming)
VNRRTRLQDGLDAIAQRRSSLVCSQARGRPRVDLAAAAEATAALSRFGVAYRDVDELEINPLPVTPVGAVALDAPVVARHA